MSPRPAPPTRRLSTPRMDAPLRRAPAATRTHSYGRPTSYARVRHAASAVNGMVAAPSAAGGTAARRLVAAAVAVVTATAALAALISVAQSPSLAEAMLSVVAALI